jgi:exosortase/archaeosortase family protein
MLKKNSPFRFVLIFVGLFLLFYYFNIGFFGVTSPGHHYSPFLAEHLNYIQALRWLLLHSSAFILKCLGFATVVNDHNLLIAGRGAIRMVYTCLGLGVMSFFIAFVIAYPKPAKAKIWFLIAGLLGIQLLNIIRFMLLALYWTKSTAQFIDHHTIFNITIYILISITLYFWVTNDNAVIKRHAKN